MADPLKRRDFIKNMSLAGASIALTNPVSAKPSLPGSIAIGLGMIISLFHLTKASEQSIYREAMAPRY